MKQNELFKVAAAAFAAMLSRNDLYLDYFALWANQKGLNYGDSLHDQWSIWAKTIGVNLWLAKAFHFSQGHIPMAVWMNLNDEWSKWLKQNLNK